MLFRVREEMGAPIRRHRPDIPGGGAILSSPETTGPPPSHCSACPLATLPPDPRSYREAARCCHIVRTTRQIARARLSSDLALVRRALCEGQSAPRHAAFLRGSAAHNGRADGADIDVLLITDTTASSASTRAWVNTALSSLPAVSIALATSARVTDSPYLHLQSYSLARFLWGDPYLAHGYLLQTLKSLVASEPRVLLRYYAEDPYRPSGSRHATSAATDHPKYAPGGTIDCQWSFVYYIWLRHHGIIDQPIRSALLAVRSYLSDQCIMANTSPRPLIFSGIRRRFACSEIRTYLCSEKPFVQAMRTRCRSTLTLLEDLMIHGGHTQ